MRSNALPLDTTTSLTSTRTAKCTLDYPSPPPPNSWWDQKYHWWRWVGGGRGGGGGGEGLFPILALVALATLGQAVASRIVFLPFGQATDRSARRGGGGRVGMGHCPKVVLNTTHELIKDGLLGEARGLGGGWSPPIVSLPKRAVCLSD